MEKQKGLGFRVLGSKDMRLNKLHLLLQPLHFTSNRLQPLDCIATSARHSSTRGSVGNNRDSKHLRDCSIKAAIDALLSPVSRPTSASIFSSDVVSASTRASSCCSDCREALRSEETASLFDWAD
jgi:hypothetical protein